MKGHPVSIDIAPDIPLIKTDQALLQQALANILHNAAVYTPGDPPVELTIRHAEQKLRLTVRDHGPGLPPGEEGRVFGKFYRAPGGPADGTGLGLSIARGLVHALGGDIAGWNHPQGGAVFEILLKADFLSQEADGQTHYLRVYANHLRKKLGDKLVIQNEAGIGYRLLGPA